MRPSFFLVPTVLVVALAAACQPQKAPGASTGAAGAQAPAATGAEQEIQYRCGDQTVQATFRGEDSATVVIDGRTYAMTGESAASGARYVDAVGNVLWTKGTDEAVLTLQGGQNRSCSEVGVGGQAGADAALGDPAPSSFRAAGSDSGWLASVNARSRAGLHVEVDHGQTVYEVPAPTQGPDGWAGTATDGTLVKLSIQRAPCQDSASGDMYPARAMLAVGARQLHGCGSFHAAH